MRKHLKHLRAPIAVLAATAMVAFAPATAFAADPNPLEDTVKSVEKTVGDTVEETVKGATGGATTGSQPGPQAKRPAPLSPRRAAANAPAPSAGNDDDSPGHETRNPSAPDHGASKNVDANLGGEDVADVGGNNATVNDDDSTKADSTLLAIGGNEVIGSHSDSENGPTEDGIGDPLAPLCEGTSGGVCASLLFSRTSATDDGTTSRSTSESGVADACVGGSSTDPEATCTGPVATEVATSNAQAQRDQASGRTTASSESNTVGLCIARDTITGACQVGAGVIESEGQSDSGGANSSASRSSSVADLVVAGEGIEFSDEPDTIGCDIPQVLCAFVNQGETYLGTGVAGHAQEALHVDLLKGTPLAGVVEVSRTETLVHNDGGEQQPPTDDNNGGDDGDDGDDNNGGDGGSGDDNNAGDDGSGDDDASAVGNFGSNAAGGDGDDSNLPNTGGPTAILLAAGLLAIAMGAFLTASGRRRNETLA